MKTLHITQKVRILLEDIRYLQADINYTIIYTRQDKRIVSSTNIKKLNDKIACNGFIRINRRYVLNKIFIKAYNDTDSSVMLDDGQIFLLSRRKNRTLRDILNQM